YTIRQDSAHRMDRDGQGRRRRVAIVVDQCEADVLYAGARIDDRRGVAVLPGLHVDDQPASGIDGAIWTFGKDVPGVGRRIEQTVGNTTRHASVVMVAPAVDSDIEQTAAIGTETRVASEGAVH